MKKSLIRALILLLVLVFIGNTSVFGAINNKYSNQILPSSNLSRTLDGAMTLDFSTEIIMYSNNVNKSHPIDGGLARLMSVYTAYNAIRNDASKKYDITEYELEELCVRMIYNNDAGGAAKEMAARVAGGEGNFTQLMNQTAASLKMTATVYKNCTGKREDGQVSTIYDQILLLNECYDAEFIRKILKGSVYFIEDSLSYSRNVELMDETNTKYYDKRVTHYLTSDYSSEGYFMFTASNVNQTNATGRVVITCMYQSGASDYYAGMLDTRILNNNSFGDYYWVTLVDLAKDVCQKTPFKLPDGKLAYCAIELKGNETGITTISRDYFEKLQENHSQCTITLSSNQSDVAVKPGELLGLGELYFQNDLLLSFDLRVVRIVSDDGKMISSDYSLYEPENYLEQIDDQYDALEFIPYSILVIVFAFAAIAAARYVRQKWMI